MHRANQTSYKKGHIPLGKRYDFCTINGCGNNHEAHGYCVMHYKRWRRTGDPLTPMRSDPRAALPYEGYFLIPLGVYAKDGYTKVLDKDKYLEKYKWHLSNSGYAATRINGRLIAMHVLIMNPPTGLEVDHRNRIRTDNRRTNLRSVTRQVNALNTGIRSTNTSGYTGVSFSKAARKYGARITRNGISHHLGLFKTAEEAHGAYCRAAEVL